MMFIIGVFFISFFLLKDMPISFLPNIEISQLRVITKSEGRTARNIENTITKPVSSFLKTLNNVKSINSESQEGISIITIDLKPSINLDIATIEISEKLDQSMQFLPMDVERPLVIRSSLSDIPVLKISVTPKDPKAVSLIELSEFCEKILRRRIEQQNEVSLADFHGLASAEIKIIPNNSKLSSLNISNEDLIQTIQQANLTIANITLLDGDYQFDVELGNKINSIEEIKNISFSKNGERFNLKELASVVFIQEETKSAYLYNGKEGIVINVLKKKDSNSIKLKSELEQLIVNFTKEYSALNFDILDDQTKILEENISNLKMALLYGVLFSGIILFFFLREFKLSIIVFLIIPISLVFVLLGYSLLGIGLNTISLTGLILGVGLMIDNAIIIIDNIQWEYQSHKDLTKACMVGTQGVIKPLIGSALTTSSVFAPLMLLSDTAGFLFYELSVSIILALFLSLIVSYFLLPTAINFFKLKYRSAHKSPSGSLHKIIVQASLKYKFLYLLLYCIIILCGIHTYNYIKKERFPKLTNDALVLTYNWEDHVALEINKLRIQRFLDIVHANIEESSSILGMKQFIKENNKQSIAGGDIYIKFNSNLNIESVQEYLTRTFQNLYPRSDFKLKPHKNTFDYILPVKQNQITCYITSIEEKGIQGLYDNQTLFNIIKAFKPSFKALDRKDNYEITIKDNLLSQYGLQKKEIIERLKIIFNKNKITSIQRNERTIDIKLFNSKRVDIYNLLHQRKIQNKEGIKIQLGNFINIDTKSQVSVIKNSQYGESIMVEFKKHDSILLKEFKSKIEQINGLKVNIAGEYFNTKNQINQLLYILIIVISLLYMILAAQFESLKTPFIIIAIIPISIIGAIISLLAFSQSINLVSIVGIISMSGIVINDAILKIDLIIHNRQNNMSLSASIINASHKRLRPILMTSITTILAFSPIFFTNGLGAELQIPLAVSIIGGLTFGTLASIFILPSLYYLLAKQKT